MTTSTASMHYGNNTAQLVSEVFAGPVERAVLLMRHSAREFDRQIHDLLNPLTDHGRTLCQQLGAQLPKSLHIKGYASPAQRCVETAELIIEAHRDGGGAAGRTRPVEAFGVFYAIDQQKMWKGLMAADGLPDYVGRWFAGELPTDAMLNAQFAVNTVLHVMAQRLKATGAESQLDVCVSHDMTLYTLRHGLGLEPLDGPAVEFLDGLLLFRRDGEWRVRSCYGGEVGLGSGDEPEIV